MEPVQLTCDELERFADERAPFVRALGITCEEVGPGHAVVRLKADPRWLRPGNILLGGGLMTLADVAIYYAILGQIGLRAMAVTNELKMNFLRPAAGGDVIART